MGPLTMALIGGGLGGLKSLLDSKRRSKAQDLRAITALYSPWTRMNPMSIDVPEVNTLGNVMQGGLTGLSMAQNYDRMNLENQKLAKEVAAPAAAATQTVAAATPTSPVVQAAPASVSAPAAAQVAAQQPSMDDELAQVRAEKLARDEARQVEAIARQQRERMRQSAIKRGPSSVPEMKPRGISGWGYY